jgi:hypothetical protein
VQSENTPSDPDTNAAFAELFGPQGSERNRPWHRDPHTGDPVYDKWDEPPDDIQAYKFLIGFKTADQVEKLPPPQWLLEGYLVGESMAMLWGEWNAGKSFLALDWAGHLGGGSYWLGQPAVKTKVLYVAAEGVTGISTRITAWKRGHNLHEMHVTFWDRPVNLADVEEMAGFTRVVKQEGFGLVIWDTLARMMPGIEENSATEVSKVVMSLDNLRRETRCTNLIVHHANKGGGSARGVSAILGACDTELQLLNGGDGLTLRVEQQRDWQRRDDMKLWLQPVKGTVSATIVDRQPLGFIPTRSSTEQQVLDHIASKAPQAQSVKDVEAALGLPYGTADRVMRKLYQSEDLLRGSSRYGYEYSLVTP